ncbi:hypothetical protein [Actinopolymorpha pittospori]|uniref:Uncharacterized protein n=1 Tax=Actinopolymorpha pittospori TaxID=648752 RepID=A0A927N2K1_9ACTN|nr:hypothetical protein [Actinopolymorpha pittospori]MBE1610974.1 hypothetical protein [Actinopolymorpha pittospori]
MNHPHDEDQAEDLVVERCWLCLGFTDLANLGPCPACQPDRFAEYLAMLAATARHHHETTEEGL